MTQAPDPLRAYYAARAAEYDRIYLKPERQADLRQIEAWLPAHFAGRRVLEVACGTGYWTRLIAPVVTHMLALDASPETLEIARRRVPPERMAFTVGDAYALHECMKSGQRFDAAFAPPEASAWRKKYFTLAERLIPPGASVLEVGCGAGGMLRHLQSQGRKVLGVDFARATVDGLVSSGVPAEVHDLRSDAPLPTGYDVVLCLEVMEHFSDPWAIYDKLWAAAGQRVVFSVPDRYMVPDDDHLYEFTYADVVHRLAPRGPVTFMGGHRCYIVAAQDKP